MRERQDWRKRDKNREKYIRIEKNILEQRNRDKKRKKTDRQTDERYELEENTSLKF